MNGSGDSDDDGIEQLLVASRQMVDAPEPLVLKVIQLAEQRRRQVSTEGRVLRLIKGLLQFDSLADGAMLAPVRASERDVRHLLLSADGVDVDVRISRLPAPGVEGWAVSGQVLGPEGTGVVRLRCGEFDAEMTWSAQGEFHFEPVPGGPCLLELESGDWRAEFPALTLPTPSAPANG
jgi:hypothetical protein